MTDHASRRFLGILALVAALLAPAAALAQGAFGQQGAFGSRPGTQQERTVKPGEEVVVDVAASLSTVRPGETVAIAFILNHADHWHSWPSAAQDVLPENIAEFALRTEVGLAGAKPDWIGLVGPVQWPEPAPAPVANPMGGPPIEVPTYQGRAIAYLPVIIAEDAEAGEYTLDVRAFFQACDDKVCLAPRTEQRSLAFTVAPAGADTQAPAPGEDFAAFDPSVFALMMSGEVAGDDGVGAGPAGPADTADELESAAAPARTFFGVTLPRGDSVLGVLVLALLGMLGGFILNLTPCVLPVIPIKVLTISKHAETPGRALTLGLWMSAGVVAFWVGIGLPMAFFSAASDPSRLFGIWWFTLGVGLLIGAMGVGIMGAFQITLPNSLYMVNPKADSPGGSFMFGVMTAVLGLPCFGFVAGALLAGAATLPAITVMVIFASLGIGMAAPYFVMALKPGLVDRIPRTGPASDLVKQIMGFLLLAAAAYFVGAGLMALTADMPWIAKQLHWWGVAFFATLGGLWLMGKTIRITSKPAPRVVFSLVGVLIAGAAVAVAVSSTEAAKRNYEARAASMRSLGADEFVPGVWNDYTPERLDAAIDSGRVVVMDFTATWCLNCKALKAAVLDVNPVRAALESDSVVPIQVDLTSTRAPGWDKLRDLGQTGIPLLVVYGPGLESPWQSNAYTSEQVLAAIERARGAAATAITSAR